MVGTVSNVAMVVALALAWGVTRRTGRASAGLFILVVATAALLLVGSEVLGWRRFAMMQAFSWAMFLYVPIFGALVAARHRLMGVFGGLVGLFAVDAFWIEPYRLQAETYAIPAATHVRVAVIADLQTDAIGAHEARAFAAVAAWAPDLVVFPGDYLQGPAEPKVEAEKFRALVRTLDPQLGGVAVEGDHDGVGWEQLFAGSPIRTATTSQTWDLGPITVTGLTTADAALPKPPVPARDGLHIVVTHRPDVALARPDVDAIVAGHTHGGQVQIPGFGPLITLTAVPRSWAAGLTELPWGGWLFVSRGVGMERASAPRLRFWCPPEVALLELGG